MSNLDILTNAVNNMADLALPAADLSLGCDIIDLMVSGEIGKAIGPGRFAWYHGDSGSGKSFHTKSVLAEASISPNYADHRLIIFDSENGSNFDTAAFFGPRLAERLEAMEAKSLDHLYDALDELVKEPCIILVDSWDGWVPASMLKKIKDAAAKRAQDKEPDGDYAVEHGKIHSTRLRLLVNKLRESGSILLGVSQHRANMDQANKYSPKSIVPGGRALKFYSHIELETKLRDKIIKEVNGNKIQIGDVVAIQSHKNRMTGIKASFEAEFYPSHGTDNIGSTLRWLQDNKYITCNGGRYSFPFLGEKKYYREELIAKIEAENKEPNLQAFLVECFADWRGQLAVERKGRYDELRS